VFNDQSPEVGYVQLLNNHFGDAFFVSDPVCELNVPYPYEHILLATEVVPSIVGDTTEPPVSTSNENTQYGNMHIFPNPANNEVVLQSMAAGEIVKEIILLDFSGHLIRRVPLEKTGNHNIDVSIDLAGIEKGLYLIEITTDRTRYMEKLLIMR